MKVKDHLGNSCDCRRFNCECFRDEYGVHFFIVGYQYIGADRLYHVLAVFSDVNKALDKLDSLNESLKLYEAAKAAHRKKQEKR